MRGTGCFYGELTPFVLLGLNDVRSRTKGGRVPEVVDVGAGNGHHAGLLALAGGRVTMLENDPSVFDERKQINLPMETVGKMLDGNLPPDVSVEDRACLLAQDACVALASPQEREKYDFANVANVLHLMTPTAAKACVKGLYNALKPGGVAHIHVQCLHVLLAHKVEENVFDMYCQRVKEGAAFPGWMGLTRYHHETFVTKMEPLDEAHPQPPMEIYLNKGMHEGKEVTVESAVAFAYDVATLTRMFEGVGFESASIMFEMSDRSLTTVAPGQETFVDALQSPDLLRHSPVLQPSYGAVSICYVARKPA